MEFFGQLLKINDPVLSLGLLSFCLLLLSMPIAFWALAGQKKSNLVTFIVVTTNLILTSLLILRWWQSGHFPISNLYESLCFLTWALTFSLLLIESNWDSPIPSATVIPMSLLTIAFASFILPDDIQSASPLVPALRSSWLVMHVSVIMCSYASLIIGSLLSMVVIFIDRDSKLQIRNSSVGVGGFRNNNISQNIDLTFPKKNNVNITSIELSVAEQIDSYSYRSISLGFLLLTMGLISGAVWANEAWGSWWSWDPKETWALICWLVYAAYLHTRLVKGWQGRRPAFVASFGLFFIATCYIGVNLLGVGLHSYGWFL